MPVVPIDAPADDDCLLNHSFCFSTDMPMFFAINWRNSDPILLSLSPICERSFDRSEACQDSSATTPATPSKSKSTHSKLARARLIPFPSNHCESGRNNIASREAMAIGIRNSRPKYIPLTTRKVKKRIDMLFEREGEAVNIVSSIRYQVSGTKSMSESDLSTNNELRIMFWKGIKNGNVGLHAHS